MEGRRARWRLPLILIGVLLACMLAPVILVGTSAPPLRTLPPPDRELAIKLPDGTETSLGELLDGTVPPPAEPTRDMEIRRQDGSTFTFTVRLPDTNDLYTVGVHNAWNGDMEAAIECLTRIPRTDPSWSRAQRFLGLRVYARSGNAAQGVPYVHAALAADPLEGNAWQDAARVYLQALGVDSQ